MSDVNVVVSDDEPDIINVFIVNKPPDVINISALTSIEDDSPNVIVSDDNPDIINITVVNEVPDIIDVDIVYPTGSEGPPGPPGLQGVQGPPGIDGGSAFNYVHQQMVPDTLWTIVHNLNGYPNVTVVESDGSEIEGDISYIDITTITFEIAWPVSGKAYLS